MYGLYAILVVDFLYIRRGGQMKQEPGCKLSRLAGENVRMIRKKKGISQRDLASQCHIAPAHLCCFEKGQRNVGLEVLERLMTALKIRPVDIFQREIV